MKRLLLICLMTAVCQCIYAKKKSLITVTTTGYSGEMMYFDFMQQPEINTEYTYREGETISFEVELNDITMLKINAWIWICLKPGDSITVDLQYEKKTYKAAEFRGAEDVVAVNNALRDMRMLRIENRYKMDPKAAMITLVPADKYHAMCLEEWKKETEILNQAKGYMPEKMYYFLLSEHEAIFLSNLITYPALRASYDGKAVEDILPEGYWNVLDNYTVRSDAGSLLSSNYAGFLLPYSDYVRKRDMIRKGMNPYEEKPYSLEEGFEYLVDFYDKNLRDAALCVYLYNAAAAGMDFNVIDKLTAEYLKKYNKNKTYKRMLLEVMQ